MNVLVLGSGGREHALSWKIAQSPLVEQVYVAPGNAGTAENVALDIGDHAAVAAFSKEKDIGLVVVGPDDLLASGITDHLRGEGIVVFGPSKEAAKIEWSKAFAKELMQEAGVPTAASGTFNDFDTARAYVREQGAPIVVKASGLALGKGVVIAQTVEEAEDALRDCFDGKFGDAGKEVVIEEFLEGIEISIHALCAGLNSVMFPPAQDHKRIGEGNTGPNTGGMGTVAPVLIDGVLMEKIRSTIVRPILAALINRGTPFAGMLFPGLMLTRNGPKVLEFNARFGDPETQSYMRLLDSDIVPALAASAQGNLSGITLTWSHSSVACVVLASAGYPGAYEKGKEITGLETVPEGVVVFHAGTKQNDDAVMTNGGRVLGVTAIGEDIPGALKNAYAAVEGVSFEGKQFRRDLGTDWFLG